MIFAIVQVIIATGAAIVYAFQRDWWRALYWLCAAVITFTITKLK